MTTRNLVIQKFGGAALRSTEHIKLMAARLARERQQGVEIVVVVSAIKGETDRLLALCRAIAPEGDRREDAVITATGEQISAGLMALALSQLGLRARSFLGFQAKILTDSHFTEAQIQSVQGQGILESLNRGEIPVVAGFQGVDSAGNITTLGRGGSDVTAVALGAALGAKRCHFVKDVEGVFTTDPHLCPTAKKIARLSYAQMHELTSLGAKVLHPRSVALAERLSLPLHVGRSTGEWSGTRIDDNQDVSDSLALTTHQDLHHAEQGHVSIVTNRFRPQQPVEQFMKAALTHANIPILRSFFTQLSASCVVPISQAEPAVQFLHERSLTWTT